MMAKNHILVTSAVVVSILKFNLIKFGTNYQFFIFYFTALFGCLLPDIDEKESYIGRKLLVISIFVTLFLRHKTYTHFLFLPILLASIGHYYFNGEIQLVLYGLSFGIFLHGLEDMITNYGIKGYLFPFFPNTNIVLLPSILRFETGSMVERLSTYFLFLPINALLIYKVLIP